jgi:hypothetical protein
MGWFDDLGTRIGDALIAGQYPLGQPMPGGSSEPTPQQRQGMIGSSLLTLGAALSQGARQRLPIGESIGAGWDAMQQRGLQQVQMGLLGTRLGESQRRNATVEMLGRMKPPPGVEPDIWRGMVATDPGRAFELYIRIVRKLAADRGGTAPEPGGGVPQPAEVPGPTAALPAPIARPDPGRSRMPWHPQRRRPVL